MISDSDLDSVSDNVDSRPPAALETEDMGSGSPVLRAELERIEASIAEIRKQELDVDTRLGDVQQEKNELAAARRALEDAANVLRSTLTRSVPSQTVVPFPTSPSQRHGPQPVPRSPNQ